MKLRLKNINYRGEDRSQLFMSIDATYGWEQDMYSDLIRINCNLSKKKLYITVEAINPGVGIVIERIIESVNEIDMIKITQSNYAETILENLAENFGMEYDSETVTKDLK